MMEAMYLSITSSDEVVFLPSSLNLENYGCGVLDVVGSFEPYSGKPLFLCCDFIRPSIVGDQILPVLRRIPFSRGKKAEKTVGKMYGSFQKMLWFPVSRPEVGEVRLYIMDKRGDIPSFDRFNLSCTLVCIPKKNCTP